MQLVVYENACRAVAQAKTVDEAKEILNRAEAARAYAKQAKNKQLEIDAMEIRVRAECRLGEIILELKANNVLGKQGQFHGVMASERRATLLTLKDLGIDGEDSAKCQRLAAVPNREEKIKEWRQEVESSDRMTMPLQTYRVPSARADREKASFKKGRRNIDVHDPFDVFRAPDGRRIADWRYGELERLESLFDRAANAARRLREEMPVANPDPLATCEILYKTEELRVLLTEVFEIKVPTADAGLNGRRLATSRKARTRVCEQCKSKFVMDARGNTAGRFCSRPCAWKAQRKH